MRNFSGLAPARLIEVNTCPACPTSFQPSSVLLLAAFERKTRECWTGRRIAHWPQVKARPSSNLSQSWATTVLKRNRAVGGRPPHGQRPRHRAHRQCQGSTQGLSCNQEDRRTLRRDSHEQEHSADASCGEGQTPLGEKGSHRRNCQRKFDCMGLRESLPGVWSRGRSDLSQRQGKKIR